jgi:hypothetical protein
MSYAQVIPTIASIPGLQAALDAKAAKAGESFTGACTFDGSLACVAQLSVAGGTKVVNAPILDLFETWNASGQAFVGIQLNVTNTNSHADSRLLALNVGGSERFAVTKDGGVIAAAASSFAGEFFVAGGEATDVNHQAVSLTHVWNGAGIAFSAMHLTVIDTLSAVNAKFIRCELNDGFARFEVLKTGSIVTNSIYSLSASAPALDASQTWNNAGVAFKGLSLNVTDTASAAASKLIDLLVGGASKFSVSKAGCIESSSAVNHGSAALILGDGSAVPKVAAYQNSGGLVAVSSTGSFLFSSTSNAYSGAADAALHRVAAGVLSVTNGTAGTYRDLRVRNVLDTNGAIVLGTRGAAVADATDAASVITQLNALLARLRATGGHGLIAD